MKKNFQWLTWGRLLLPEKRGKRENTKKDIYILVVIAVLCDTACSRVRNRLGKRLRLLTSASEQEALRVGLSCKSRSDRKSVHHPTVNEDPTGTLFTAKNHTGTHRLQRKGTLT